MDQIYPAAANDIDPATLVTEDVMARRGTIDGRPWVMANMIMSSDGAYARAGRSGGLGGPADKAMFHTLRGLADVILVGAGTARKERYRRPAGDPETIAVRTERGQEPAPRLALVSQSGHFPEDQPFLSGAGPDPIVFLPADNRPEPDAELSGVEYRAAGNDDVDLADLVGQLGADGAGLVLCEGGPRLLGDLAEANLLNQIFITIAPQLVGGSHTGLLGDRPELEGRLTLNSVAQDESYLLLNYIVAV